MSDDKYYEKKNAEKINCIYNLQKKLFFLKRCKSHIKIISQNKNLKMFHRRFLFNFNKKTSKFIKEIYKLSI